ncbi:MAG: DUF6754 domain-containing protein, partial [Planctomycetales bacterium]
NPPAPPTKLTARDHPNDVGTAIDLTWTLSSDDRRDQTPRRVQGYEIFRVPVAQAEGLSDLSAVEPVGDVPYRIQRFTDQQCQRGVSYIYWVRAIGTDHSRSEPAALAKPVQAERQWIDRSRLWFGVIVVLVCGSVIWFTRLARSGRKLYIREIAGLKAIGEAVGRATEMGRPVLFVPGIQDMNEIATVAGINILSHVARTVAEYDSSITVPTSRSMVMTAARETVAASFLAAGRPEAYDEHQIYYVTDEQFAYVAHLTGYMVREQPAACFYAGTFFAESLILAETGNAVGALQIAGTAEASQLPFFVAACDYTLLGEELFAASAYLSGEPDQLGSLKGQDVGKLLAVALLLVGCLLATVAMYTSADSIASKMLTYLRDTILGRGGMG